MTQSKTPAAVPPHIHALEKLIEHAGGKKPFAAKIEESAETVNNWLKRGVPGKKCRKIENAFPGVVTAEQLCPDVFEFPQSTEKNKRKKRAA